MNYYEQPAQANFINTYVPTPFEQLMNVGDRYRQEIEKTEAKLAGFRKEHSQFQSLSDADRQQYYDLTFGKVSPAVEQMAKNPEFLKTAEGRSQISGLINQIDYGQLAQLRKSAETLDQYQKTKTELKAKGLYSADWDDVDLAKYDTATQGVFSEVSPMRYKSIKNLTDTYFDQLDKTKHLRSDGMWEVSGIDKADLENVANEKVINEIYALPETQKHIEVARRKGMIPEGMSEREWLRDNVIQSQVERIGERRELNPLAVMQYKENLEMKKIAARANGKGVDAPDVEPASMYSILHKNATDNEQNLIQREATSFTALNDLVQQTENIAAGTKEQLDVLDQQLADGVITKQDYDKSATALMKQYEKDVTSTSSPEEFQKAYQSGIKTMYEGYLGIPGYEELSPKDRKKIKGEARSAQAADQLLSAISTPAPGSVIGSYNNMMGSGELSIKQGGNVVTGYSRPNTANLELSVDFSNKLMGSKQKTTYKVKSSYSGIEKDFGADFRSGAIKDIIVVPDNQVLANKEKGVNKIAQKIRIKIPKSSLIDMGYDADSLDSFFSEKFGVNKETNINPKPISTKTIEDTYGTESTSRWFGSDKITKQGAPYAGEYYTIEAVENIDPNTAGVIMFESNIDKTVGGTKQSGSMYVTRQAEALFNK